MTDIPQLEEHIPPSYFPDSLIVHDPFDVSSGFLQPPYLLNDEPSTHLYRRLYPTTDKAGSKDSGNPNIAHLYLSPFGRIGTGHHSAAYAAPLKLPSPLSTYKSSSCRPGTVQVVAKVAFPERDHRDLLDNEGKVYNNFPKHMSDEYCGWHSLWPLMQNPAPAGAVVPKFYGFYIPEYRPDEAQGTNGRSPILLVEICGKPINTRRMSTEERAQCFSLLARLHLDEYYHGSFYERNIVKQPGPLTVPPSERSLDTPSFRVIDFGRTEHYRTRLEREQRQRGFTAYNEEKKGRVWDRFERDLKREMRDARTELEFGQTEAI
ncbi:hypothetical protein C8Q75DRAFT_715555 [Abortiporus biennis]|nr:hypothetical protein C8Q75DRAFT_715555 [Abortiporus biennis]